MGALKSYRCSKGHVLAGKNLYLRSNGTRECRKCSLARSKQFAQQARLAKAPQPPAEPKGRSSHAAI